MVVKRMWAVSVMAIVGAGLLGCGKSAEQQPADPATAASNGADDHSGWWCDEHGVPEDVCALCDTDLVAEFKAKGDWCEEHNRPDSQCFTCNPEKEVEFAALYEAKYGTKPPKPTEDGA